MLDTLKFVLANRVLILIYSTTMLVTWCAFFLLVRRMEPDIDAGSVGVFCVAVAFVVGGWAGLFLERRIVVTRPEGGGDVAD